MHMLSWGPDTRDLKTPGNCILSCATLNLVRLQFPLAAAPDNVGLQESCQAPIDVPQEYELNPFKNSENIQTRMAAEHAAIRVL